MALLDKRAVDPVEPKAEPNVQVTTTEAMYVEPSGTVRWRHLFAAPAEKSIARGSAGFFPDGEHVWVYRPDAMLGRGEGDGWLVLRAADGRLVAEETLPTAGQGAGHVPHPDGVHMLLDVGEGQDGSLLFRGRLDGTALDVHAYPWNDRVLIGFSPDGNAFMTVDHSQADVAFHTFPAGERTYVVDIDRLPQPEVDDEDLEVMVGWGGGYLDATTAVVIVEWQSDDEEGRAFHLLDLSTGSVLGQLDIHEDNYDIELPGDGSWINRDEHGRPTRWTLA
ncbi:hypothetical protein F4560_004454 [Saccharothrix ecbatanensis]|uniref:WD40 repeat protein n=1 Tax=Saccharothrix ecbatanensis TaxID=1105145 RepID=A0A7W9M285_9PSEU|nr:hypothetical protein [Saccharothrix ecbatanensis]MBB5804686.1 hypothetical protein [Saccharothrix ecbatanensis]